jgi:hypothetical protein
MTWGRHYTLYPRNYTPAVERQQRKDKRFMVVYGPGYDGSYRCSKCPNLVRSKVCKYWEKEGRVGTLLCTSCQKKSPFCTHCCTKSRNAQVGRPSVNCYCSVSCRDCAESNCTCGGYGR